MTLNTSIRVYTDKSLADVFLDAATALLTAAGRADEVDSIITEHRMPGFLPDWANGNEAFANKTETMFSRIGQGLPGIIDASVIAPGMYDVSWDTAYGYDHNGIGCTELHAVALLELSKIYPDLRWQNEYTGDWYSTVRGDDLVKFMGGGAQAMDWFNNLLIPTLTKNGLTPL